MIGGFIGYVQFSCKKNNDLIGNPKGYVTKTSECKLKNTEVKKITAATESCIVYDYFETTHVMKLWHNDAAFNCGMTKVTCSVSLSNDTLTINEIEAANIANCDCLYDVELQIDNLKSGKYILYIKEPYVGNQQKLIFPVDLDKDPSGEYCVPRSYYPWGL
jgi:hypothetical protein